MTVTAYDVPLVDLYRKRELLSVDDPPRSRHLPTMCPKASLCWAGLAVTHQPPEGTDASELSAPWIGSAYDAGRTVIVLENLRNYGGFDLRIEASKGMRFLGRVAHYQLAEGRRRLFGSKTYRGTDVWPRALAYAAIWLDSVGVLAKTGPTEVVSSAALSAAQDHVAIVQHVKCSPRTPGSEQTPAMWENCGRLVLADELAILRPARLLVLGTGDNARAMREHVLKGPAGQRRQVTATVGSRSRAITLMTIDSTWGPVEVVVAPHPAGQGGNSRKLLDLLRQVLAPATMPTSTNL
jgi:hypothetical protein